MSASVSIVNEESSTVAGTQAQTKRAIHPFLLRLGHSSGLSVDSPLALVNAGFASIAMGLLTVFRVTPVLMFVLSRHVKAGNYLCYSRLLLLALLSSWTALLLFVFFLLGFILVASLRIHRRWPLMLHPWGLLLLYLDVFFWVSMVLWMHLVVVTHPEGSQRVLEGVQHPLPFFVCMYVEALLFGTLNYLYATYFIIAELTVIEHFF